MLVGQGARRRRPVRVPRSVQRLLGPCLLLVAWQLVSSRPVIGSVPLPGPADVVRSAWTLIDQGTLQRNMFVSLKPVGQGLAIGLLAGMTLSLLAGLLRIGENIIDANMAILRAVPTLAMLPIFIIWFGIDEQPKVLLIAVGVTVQIYITTFSAIRSVDQGLVEAARTFGIRRLGLVRMVILPGAIPGFLTGLRFALAGSWLSLIYAETLNAREGLGRKIGDLVRDTPIASVHPVVRVHPETGEKVLYVNPGFTTHIVDLQPRESRHLLDLLYEQVSRPEYTVRFKWEPGSIAFWDNRAALHLAPRDQYHLEDVRILHRITLVGDIPVGPDGRQSESLDGEFFGAA